MHSNKQEVGALTLIECPRCATNYISAHIDKHMFRDEFLFLLAFGSHFTMVPS